MMRDNNKKKQPHPLYTSILLLLLAVAAVTAATMAWLSIADNTKVRSMSMDVTSGVSLRFDLDAHQNFEQYVKTLNFAQISQRIAADLGFSMQETPLEPVTTSDYVHYSKEDGSEVLPETGAYLTFELNFMSTKDMIVHLTTAQGSATQGGTSVASSNSGLPPAMRISFTVDGTTSVYDPGMEATSSGDTGNKMFGLPPASSMVYNNDNALFHLTANQNKTVLVHIWMEGTDPACNDDLKGADYAITMRFEGTDSNNRLFEEINTEEALRETETTQFAQ